MFFEAASPRTIAPGTTLRQRLATYSQNDDRWFDGKISSVDHRLEQNARMLHEARQMASQKVAWIPVVSELEADHNALTGIRTALVTAAQDREAEYTPGESFTNHKHDSGDGGRCKWCKNDASHPHHQQTAALAPQDARWVELEATRFVRDNADADARELSIRSASHAQYKTGHLSPRRSAAITQAFVNRSEALRSSRPTQRRVASAPPDLSFDASLIYL